MASQGAPTLADVARRAGVSLTTASKAINGRDRVSAQTRDRVLEAARALSFTPNPMARSLISGRSGTVGLIIVDSLAQRFAVPIMLGAEEALSQIDLSLMIADARGDTHRLRTILSRYRDRKVDGILVVGDNNTATPSITSRLRQPVAYVYGESTATDVAHVPDDRAGGRALVEHLIQLGRRRLAVVLGPRESRASRERLLGVQDAMAGTDTVLVSPPIHIEWSQHAARLTAGHLIEQQPDVEAVICGSDQIASGVVEALTSTGRQIPDDVAVTGFDNWTIFALETDPHLTTVDMNLHALGAAAVRDLFGMIDGEPVGSGVRSHLCELIVRGSTRH